jgi:hypothetical protein
MKLGLFALAWFAGASLASSQGLNETRYDQSQENAEDAAAFCAIAANLNRPFCLYEDKEFVDSAFYEALSKRPSAMSTGFSQDSFCDNEPQLCSSSYTATNTVAATKSSLEAYANNAFSGFSSLGFASHPGQRRRRLADEVTEMKSRISSIKEEMTDFAVLLEDSVDDIFTVVDTHFGSNVVGFIPPRTYVVHIRPANVSSIADASAEIKGIFPMPGWIKERPMDCNEESVDCNVAYVSLSNQIVSVKETVALAKNMQEGLVTAGYAVTVKVTSLHNLRVYPSTVGAPLPYSSVSALIAGFSNIDQVTPRRRYKLYGWLSNEGMLSNYDDRTFGPGFGFDKTSELYKHWTNGLDGTGQTVSVSDTGVKHSNCYFHDTGKSTPINKEDMSHRKIVGYFAHADADVSEQGRSDHGTHVAGSIMGHKEGTAVGSEENGIAPHAKLSFYDIVLTSGNFKVPDSLGNDYFNWAKTKTNAYISSNSWGSAYAGYSDSAKDIDDYVFKNDDFLVLFAAGNSGSQGLQSLGEPATNKNGIAIGASQRYKYESNALSDYSSRGPTLDGRMKPDIVGIGSPVNAADSIGTGSCPTTDMSGTSMATPMTAGIAALARQYLEEGYYPTGVKTNANKMLPTAALLKAMLINSAVPLAKIRRNDECSVDLGKVPSVYQGYGRVTLDRILRFPGNAAGFGLDLKNRESVTKAAPKTYYPSFDPEKDGNLRVTLVWTDPPGSTQAAKVLVNDLDLKLEVGGQTYYPNGGNTKDTMNNVEQIVFKPTGQKKGDFKITVTASTLGQGTSQNFALVISGGKHTEVVATRPCTSDVCASMSARSRERNQYNQNGKGTVWDCYIESSGGGFKRTCPNNCALKYDFGWSPWSPCDPATKKESRTIACIDDAWRPKPYVDSTCTNEGKTKPGTTSEERSCAPVCSPVVNCRYTAWSCGSCSATAAGASTGTQTCTRTKINDASCGGTCADTSTSKTQSCTPGCTPKSCVMSSWTCPQGTCTGTRTCTRTKTTPESCGGQCTDSNTTKTENCPGTGTGGGADNAGGGDSTDVNTDPEDASDDATKDPQFLIICAAAGAALVALVIGFFVYKKRQNSNLPAGWTAVKDLESGKTYYQNQFGKTQWEKPMAPKARKAPRVKSKRRGKKAGKWDEYLNEDGESYWVNSKTGESTWDKPTCEHDWRKSRFVQSTPRNGWMEFTSDDGEKYWHNAQTGETSWEPQGGPITNYSNPMAMGEGPPIPASGLPDGWTRQQWTFYGEAYLRGEYD